MVNTYDNYKDAIDAEGVGATVKIKGQTGLKKAEMASGYTGTKSTSGGTGSNVIDKMTGIASNVAGKVGEVASNIKNDVSMGLKKLTMSDDEFNDETKNPGAADFNRRTADTVAANAALMSGTKAAYDALSDEAKKKYDGLSKVGNNKGYNDQTSNDDNGSNNQVDDGTAEEVVVPEVSMSEQILQMAKDAGVDLSNELITEINADPDKFLKDRGMKLSDLAPTLDAETEGTVLDPSDPRYDLGDDPTVTATTVDDIETAGTVTAATPTKYDAATSLDQLGTPETTVNAATGTIDQDNLVTAEQIDMTGAATGVNADGTISVTGEALNNFATQNISNIIDTSTVAGKLLANKLGEGNYTDSKATVLGQMKIISDEFKDSNGNPGIIPPWAQAMSRDVAKSMAFKGITGTAATAAMSTAIMEATLGVAEKEATFFQTLTTKNLDNRQQAIINKATIISKFEVANLDNRQAAAVQNAKSFLEMDLKNLTNEQQAEVVNTQAMVDAIFNDQTAVNAARLFGATAENDMAKYYDNMNAQIDMHRSEQLNAMRKFNAGEENDAGEFNATMEDGRDRFYSTMQYNLDIANAKWRQSVAETNTEMKYEAAAADVKNMMDISSDSMTRLWDRVDNTLDYIFKGSDAEAQRDAMILAETIRAQSGQKSGGNSIFDAIVKIGVAYATSGSDQRLKENLEYQDTVKGIKFYTWDWTKEAKEIGWDKFPSKGVIAQQIQKTHPDAVSKGQDGYLMVNYGKLQ